ncbi:ATP synthase F1 subcomplex delta subunit [Limimonas halophila]|uniref:ATP synthase subunit delta n=2 Tax=Limimonas halophila TaxID=1082479 RepID=A0A1G7UFR4_9PROT|nr:ATP synthase F1 subcomplex delta subunit [Limimonas halophila]
MSGLAARYAQALLELADEKKKLDAVAEDLRGLQQLIADSDDLRRFIRNPLYGRQRQVAAMKRVMDDAGADPVTVNFVQLVARNGRLFALPEMAQAYLDELARRRGEITAQVTVARELTDKQAQQLEEALRQSVGGKVHLETTVDRSLIGGMVVRVGSRMVDNSLRSKLNRLEHALKGAG